MCFNLRESFWLRRRFAMMTKLAKSSKYSNQIKDISLSMYTHFLLTDQKRKKCISSTIDI